MTFAICGAVAFCDQATKLLARVFLANGPQWESVPILPDVLYLHYITNSAGCMGLMIGLPEDVRPFFFTLVTLFFGAYLVFLIRRLSPNQEEELVPLALIIGGVLGNGIDRVVHGEVIDWALVTLGEAGMPFSSNGADVAIFVGLFWILLYHLKLGRRNISPSEHLNTSVT